MTAFASIGNSIAYADFKRAADGAWIFRAPVPWVFGNRPHYLLTDNQKDEVEEVSGRSFLVWPALIIALALLPLGRGLEIAHGVLPQSILGQPSLPFVIGVCGILLSFLQNTYRYFALREMLSHASRTAQRITFQDRLRIRAARQSRQRLKHGIAACAIVGTLGLLNMLTGLDPVFSFFAIVGASLFLLFFSALLMAKSDGVSRPE